MFGHRIKIDEELFKKVERCAAAAGYATTEEFVAHVLEKEVGRILGPGGESSASEEEIKKRLQGLGYIE